MGPKYDSIYPIYDLICPKYDWIWEIGSYLIKCIKDNEIAN